MRALLSVSDKTGIVEFAKQLKLLDIEIISTGGTYKILKENNIDVINISEITNFPECLDGRVKTLHPNIHAGILAIRSNEDHMKQLENFNIQTIDIVVVNLYPFKETILKEGVTREICIENIDIGGPTMLRAAAKNYQDVAVVTDPKDYSKIIDEMKKCKEVSLDTKFYLCSKVFEHTAHYDSLISMYLKEQRNDTEFSDVFTMTFEKVQDMRYGENPHQRAAFYREVKINDGLLTSAKQLHGKELSFNNINDTNGALELLKEFDEVSVVGCKHSNPCGVGVSDNIYDAYMKAYLSDTTSIYGGIVVCNREIDMKTAEEISKIFVEIIAAPSYEEEALNILKRKKNIRILQIANITKKQDKDALDIKKVAGGLLVQTIDSKLFEDDNNFEIELSKSIQQEKSNLKDLKKEDIEYIINDEQSKHTIDKESNKDKIVVTKEKPNEQEIKDMIMAWKIVKHTKSNAITIVKNGQSIGIGPGQVNRVGACKQAIENAIAFHGENSLKGAALASDAFFPFSDSIELASNAGITAIIQPGGSVRDEDSIKLCDERKIKMIFTNMRHFKH